MAAPTASLSNRVVVACLNGQRLRGYIYNFSPLRNEFRIFPEENSTQEVGKDVKLEDVKAIFFVKEFVGPAGHRDRHYVIDSAAHGRKIEVSFLDGEKISGTTEAYNPKKIGFFLFPADAESNNVRIFVINKSVRGVKNL